MNPLVNREMPTTINPWLRFQVGEILKRNAIMPMFGGESGRVFMGERVTTETVSVFSLKGWGRTQAEADRMANVNQRRQPCNSSPLESF